ncbi:hypothetical protein [Nocardia shimofusensis]|uniref:hypothetical protein n=1 Tax=Nocardia shimofusensis TaxID=228596 RepID=UPI0012EE7FEF|nr:hypothetical protein [Nocardia shimofusensis]
MLAKAPDPDMWLPQVHIHRVPGRYVGKTGPQDAEKHWTVLDGSRVGLDDERTKHLWFTARAEWTHPCAFLDFSAVLDGEQISALAAAASATPYVGRATDCVMAGVLTPHDGGWVDHTSTDGYADPELAEPGSAHERWQPTAVPGPVRAATPDLLAVLDLCHERRHRYGLPGLPDHVRGRPVTYLRRDPSTSATSATRVVLLLNKGRTQQQVMSSLPDTAVLLGSDKPWAVSFESREQAAAAAQSTPELFRDGQPQERHIDRYYGRPAESWISAVPMVAHPDRRIAEHEITTGLQDVGADGFVEKLKPCGPCPELAHLTLWRAWIRLDHPYPGPLRLGQGQQYGYGRFRKDEDGEH